MNALINVSYPGLIHFLCDWEHLQILFQSFKRLHE